MAPTAPGPHWEFRCRGERFVLHEPERPVQRQIPDAAPNPQSTKSQAPAAIPSTSCIASFLSSRRLSYLSRRSLHNRGKETIGTMAVWKRSDETFAGDY